MLLWEAKPWGPCTVLIRERRQSIELANVTLSLVALKHVLSQLPWACIL